LPLLTIFRIVTKLTTFVEAILNHAELPRVVLGFMGPSGSGKSSVINALLEEDSLLPCNCTEACTAVAVEIAWNTDSDRNKAYRAEIQFVTAAEWKAELEVLVAELMSLDTEERRNPSGDDAKVAAAKFGTVYPDFDMGNLTEQSAAELMSDTIVSNMLGKVEKIEMAATRGKKFAQKIRKYIDSSPRINASGARQRKTAPYWPLIKVVQIFTKSAVLRTGLVLVDLPGSGDSNAARTIVAQDYLHQVTAICIVTDIKRALTNAVARNLFGRGAALKRQLLRDGLLDDEHTFFVLTCTDIISNQQVIQTQGLQKMPEIVEILREKNSKTRQLKSLSDKLRAAKEKLKRSAPPAKSFQGRNQSSKRRKMGHEGSFLGICPTLSRSTSHSL
jgi:GTPase SAR1 family protein